MATTDYIYLNSEAIPKPVSFMPAREDVFKGEYTTCTGDIIADRIGWKYSDIDLQWDALKQEDIEKLIALEGMATLTFDDVDGEHTESVVRSSAVSLRNRNTVDGVVWWRDVSVNLRFISTHPIDE